MDHWWESIVNKVIGGAIGTAILTFSPRLWRKLTGRKKSNDAPLPVVAPAAPQTVSASPRDSIPIRDAGARKSDGAVAGYTLDQICESIASRPPMARKQAGEGFIGIEIDWELLLGSVYPHQKDKVSLRFRQQLGDNRTAKCVVPLGQYPVLETIHEGSILRIRGRIIAADEFEVEIGEADLSLIKAQLTRGQ